MEISDDFYLRTIQKGRAFFDKKSIEPSTKRKRGKYKLAGDSIKYLEIYSFFILNKSDAALIRDLTLCIKRNDWERRDPRHLYRICSYIDISKCETLNEIEILAKVKDKKNKFRDVAKLCNAKYEELKNLLFNLPNRRIKSKISQETLNVLATALNIADELKAKLDLN